MQKSLKNSHLLWMIRKTPNVSQTMQKENVQLPLDFSSMIKRWTTEIAIKKWRSTACLNRKCLPTLKRLGTFQLLRQINRHKSGWLAVGNNCAEYTKKEQEI